MIETERLVLRPFTEADAPLMLAILNDPDFIAQVADRGVRDLEQAARAIAKGPVASRAQHGHAMEVVIERDGGAAVGICGLLRRPFFDAPDLGYAFLPMARGRGYAREAGRAALEDARDRLGVRRMLATTAPDNRPSIAVLEAIGFRFRAMIDYPDDGKPVRLFEIRF